jgi:hypothetical protein
MLDRVITRTDNHPPAAIDHAKNALGELSKWLADHPVIQAKDDAKAGVALKERTLVALNEARKEREAKTGPFREKLNAIFAAYELVKDKGTLERAYTELRKRLTSYANAVEAARIAEAERLRKEAEEREELARKAEAAEQAAIADAEAGECTDVGGAIVEADQAFSDYRRADKQAAIAERNVPLRFGSVMGGRSVSMRSTETLVIENVELAIKVLGLTDKIREAILSSARDYRKEFEELPAGIIATFERSM